MNACRKSLPKRLANQLERSAKAARPEWKPTQLLLLFPPRLFSLKILHHAREACLGQCFAGPRTGRRRCGRPQPMRGETERAYRMVALRTGLIRMRPPTVGDQVGKIGIA